MGAFDVMFTTWAILAYFLLHQMTSYLATIAFIRQYHFDSIHRPRFGSLSSLHAVVNKHVRSIMILNILFIDL